ncbi:hypothetical protein RRG08_048862 [Elysia crispata]|uniref:Sushi domain-containing protein n=1 Tax=Elysia crispata TaxID=231223 RepID=A0AAE1AG25_9GAST|nr:hypothetical protein RRG08_048862 [Elysia crispata]
MPHTPAAACAIEPFVFKTYHVDNFYRVDHADQQVIQFSCLTNFHLVAGDLRWTCQHNGTWSGTEPLCAVDFLKDKWTLSGFIITVSFFLPMLWLGTDFYRFVQKRTRVRKTRYRFGPICDIRKNEMLLGENHRIFRKVSTTYRASSIAYAMEMDYMRSAHCSDIEEFFKKLNVNFFGQNRNLLLPSTNLANWASLIGERNETAHGAHTVSFILYLEVSSRFPLRFSSEVFDRRHDACAAKPLYYSSMDLNKIVHNLLTDLVTRDSERMSSQKVCSLLYVMILLSLFHSAQTQNIFCFFLSLLANSLDCRLLGDAVCIVLAIVFDLLQCRFLHENIPTLQQSDGGFLVSSFHK